MCAGKADKIAILQHGGQSSATLQEKCWQFEQCRVMVECLLVVNVCYNDNGNAS